MARHSYISTFDDLQNWFTHLGKSKWNLYRGHHERMNRGQIIAKQDDDTASIEESWELLRNMIEMNSSSGGLFTVYVPQTEKGNQGSSVFVGINMAQHQSGRTAVAGIGGYSMGMIPADKLNEEIARERKMWDMERRLEDMEAAQEAGLGLNDILKEQLRNVDFTALLSTFAPAINGILARMGGQGAGIQLQGTPGDYHEQSATAEAPEGYAYDGSRLKPMLDTIRPHFDDDESFYGFLNALAHVFAANPAQFKEQFGYA